MAFGWKILVQCVLGCLFDAFARWLDPSAGSLMVWVFVGLCGANLLGFAEGVFRGAIGR